MIRFQLVDAFGFYTYQQVASADVQSCTNPNGSTRARLPPPPAGNSCRHGNGQMPLSSSCGGAAASLGSALICLVKLEFFLPRKQQPGPAEVVGAASQQLHCCAADVSPTHTHTPCGRRHFIQHQSILDSAPDQSRGPFTQNKFGLLC